MPKQHIDPPGLASPPGGQYSQVVASGPGRIVMTAGQVPFDADGQVVGAGDLLAQMRQCYRNVQVALEAVGASWADVLRVTVYVVALSDEARGVGRTVRDEFLPPANRPASTLLGVERLASPDFLCEVEATAVVE
jgi:enamine deaminase RidA (YjgF/YER057c/UK114 family)